MENVKRNIETLVTNSNHFFQIITNFVWNGSNKSESY